MGNTYLWQVDKLGDLVGGLYEKYASTASWQVR